MLNAIGSSLAPTQIQSTRRICSKGCAKQAGRKADFCLSTIVHVWMMRQHTARVTLGRQPAAALWGSRDAFSNPRDLVSRTVRDPDPDIAGQICCDAQHRFHAVLGCAFRARGEPMRRRDYITLVGSAAASPARVGAPAPWRWASAGVGAEPSRWDAIRGARMIL